MPSADPDPEETDLPRLEAFRRGMVAAWRSVYAMVLFSTYVGVGALCHDLHFSFVWSIAATIVIWAGPAHIIVVTMFGAGAPLIQTAIAISLTGIRLMPMVVSLLPMLRGPRTRTIDLILPAHFTAISLWVEGQRLAPGIPRDRRIVFCNGFASGMMVVTCSGTALGYLLAAELPPFFAAVVLFLTPLSILVSTAATSRSLIDRLAFTLGLVLAPLFALTHSELNLLMSSVVAGTIAYGADRWRRALR